MKKLLKNLKSKVKIVSVFAVIIAVASAIIAVSVLDSGLNKEAYTILSKQSNTATINAKGEIKSDSVTNVYAASGNIVKEIKVKLGDNVKAGDVIAVLDSGDLEKDVKETEESVNITKAGNLIKLGNAKKVYDNALKLSDENSNSEIVSAEAAVNAAKLDMDDKQKTYENNKTLYSSNAISKKELDDSEILFKNSKDTYNKTLTVLDNAKDKAIIDLDTAKSNYEAVNLACEDKTSEISLERKKKLLDDCTVKAPVDGVISCVNAVVGNPASGCLVEIQDLNNIIVTADVKEVDIDRVKLNEKALIKTDSTGDDTVVGVVAKIQQVANKEDKSLLNLKDDSNDEEAKFEVRIKADSSDKRLKIGMKARVNIVVKEEKSTYKVPSEDIVKDKDDNNCIYIARKNGNRYVVEALRITKGSEADSYTEIMGKGVKDGIIVLNNPLSYEVGKTIKIKGV